jgi:hypothetical protein
MPNFRTAALTVCTFALASPMAAQEGQRLFLP